MNDINLMKQALGKQWEDLPAPLRAHYQAQANTDTGVLDIDYPRVMQLFLNVLRLLGALINRRGQAIPTIVEKHMQGTVQHWKRTMRFADGKTVLFKSHWIHAGGNRLIEYVHPLIGLCMAVHVKDGKLYYEGRNFVVKFGQIHIPVPEWLLLGHTTIVEQATDDTQFVMDFRLQHPLFGQIYRYAGRFGTEQA